VKPTDLNDSAPGVKPALTVVSGGDEMYFMRVAMPEFSFDPLLCVRCAADGDVFVSINKMPRRARGADM
jgi:hypothetical protein